VTRCRNELFSFVGDAIVYLYGIGETLFIFGGGIVVVGIVVQFFGIFSLMFGRSSHIAV